MATLQPKSDLNVALRAVCSSLDIIEHALQNRDEARVIFSGIDFMQECMDSDGKVDPNKLDRYAGDIFIMPPEKAHIMMRAMDENMVDHVSFNVMAKRDGVPEQDGMIPCREETWIIPSKFHNPIAEKIKNDIMAERGVRSITMSELNKDAVERGDSIITIRGVDKKLFNHMIDEHSVPACYVIQDKGKNYDLSILSKNGDKFINAITSELSRMSGEQGRYMDRTYEERVKNAREIMQMGVDDRKTVLVGDVQPDGTFHEGIVMDRDGAKRVIFLKDNVLMIGSVARESYMFQATVNDRLKQYETPGVARSDKPHLSVKELRELGRDLRTMESQVREPDERTQKMFRYKDYIIRNYYSHVISDNFHDSYRDEILDRIKNAKWHALEHGLSREAQELDKDIAEGSASSVGNRSKTKTLVGIDLNTVNHDGFTLDDLGYPTPVITYMERLGIDEHSSYELGIASDIVIDELMHEDKDIQLYVAHELGVYIDDIARSEIEISAPMDEERVREAVEREEIRELEEEREEEPEH